MGQAYPELVRAEALITETLKLEETRFRKTLERGLAILDEATEALKRGDMLDGETAFTLYDTYGFPLDLTQDALRARGIGVDLDAFNAAMERQQRRRRAPPGRAPARPRPRRSGSRCATRLGATEFLGYETETAEGVVAALVARRQGGRPSSKAGETGARRRSTRRRSTASPAARSATPA